jgi:DHA1 family tetracycline resistance protein-like MFS transporter
MQTTEFSDQKRAGGDHALLFLLVMVFLNTMGMTIIGPVVPFLVQPYVADQQQLARMVGWLSSIYAVCQFLAAPGLGVLSDRYGRRPILLICLLGSAIGYLLFGLGGALWVLFLGRIVDGLTGGNFSILYAYIADRLAPEQRGAFFGRAGAVGGMGFLLGPVIGGFAAGWGNAAPAYLAAGVTLLTMLWGWLMLPESLRPDQRTTHVRAAALNPLTQLRAILALPQLRWLIAAGFCYSFPFAGLLATFGVFLIGQFGWTPGQIGLTSLMVGVMDMLVQGVLVGRLLPRLGEVRLAIVGLIGVMAGYLLIGAVAIVPSVVLLLLGVAFFAGCGGLVEPAMGSLLSRAAGPRAQGAVQGGGQAIQSLAMIIAPLWSGWIFSRFGPATPFWSGGIWIGLAILAIMLANPVLAAVLAATGEQPSEA